MSININARDIVNVNTGSFNEEGSVVHSEYIQPNYIIGPTGPKGMRGDPEHMIGWTGPLGAIGATGLTGVTGLIGQYYSTFIHFDYPAYFQIVPAGGTVEYTIETGLSYSPGQLIVARSWWVVDAEGRGPFDDSMFIAEVLEYNSVTGFIRLKSISSSGSTQSPTGTVNIYGQIGRVGWIGHTGIEPTGPAGEEGITGSTGSIGLTGLLGPVGPPTGPTGDIGSMGPSGFIGPVGKKGPTGELGIGVTGPVGNTGPTGAINTSAAGTGPTGPIGLIGPTGAIGLQGPTGVHNFVMGSMGNTGPTGPIDKSVGPDGGVGITGPLGPTGIMPVGPQGDQGITGVTGLIGSTGPTGLVGFEGLTSYDAGPAGPTGSTGIGGRTYLSSFTTPSADVVPAVNDQRTYTIDIHLDYSIGQNVIVSNGAGQGHAHRFIGEVLDYERNSGSLTVKCLSTTPTTAFQTVSFTNWVVNILQKLGPAGDVGPDGPTGLTGEVGMNSAVLGPTGPTGLVGSIGHIGPTGVQHQAEAARGVTGPIGITGPTGSNFVPYRETNYSNKFISNFSSSHKVSGAMHASDYVILDANSMPTRQTFRRALAHDGAYYEIATDNSFNDVVVDSRKRTLGNEEFHTEPLSFETNYYVRIDGGSIGYDFNDNVFRFVKENKTPAALPDVPSVFRPLNATFSAVDDKVYFVDDGGRAAGASISSLYDEDLGGLIKDKKLTALDPSLNSSYVGGDVDYTLDNEPMTDIEYCPSNTSLYITSSLPALEGAWNEPGRVHIYEWDTASSRFKHNTSFDVGLSPIGITYVPSLDRLYVFHDMQADIKMILPQEFNRIKNIHLTDSTLRTKYGAFCPTNNKLYITSTSTNLVCLDVLTEKIELIDVSAPSDKAAYCPFNNRIYVTHDNDPPGNFISVINPQGNVVEKTVANGTDQGVYGISYSPIVNKIFTTNHKNDIDTVGSVSVLDPETDTVIDNIDVGAYPTEVVYNPINGIMYAANYGTQNISFVKNL